MPFKKDINTGRFIKGANKGINNKNYNPDLHIIEKTICACGCGDYVSHPKSKPKKFIWGHNTRIRSKEEKLAQIQKAHKARMEYFKNNQRISPLYKLIKTSSKYIEWRKKVFERDGYKCQKCFKGGHLEAHHKIPFAKIYKGIFKKDLSLDENYSNCMNNLKLFDIYNGITLCQSCHDKEYHAHYILTEKEYT